MVENVIRLQPVEVGVGYRFNTDEMLEATKGTAFTRMAIVGKLKDGSIYVSGSSSAGETIILLEAAKNFIVRQVEG